MDVRKLLEAGQAAQNAAHAEGEKAKAGNLRGGTAGAIGKDGKVYGECHRVALARLLGADKEVDFNRHIMFNAGVAAEDSWAAKLAAAGVVFRRESEIPVVVKVGERLVTGRPDIVIGELVREMDGSELFVPTHGLELKGIYSASSGVRVALEGIPDPKHLAQAGFYSLALNVDYTLCYTNPSVIDVPYWGQKKFGGVKKLQPFYRLFSLRWDADETLEYKDEEKDNWVSTQITKQGILDFYALVGDQADRQELGPRPEGGYADGTPLPWDKCQYCSLSKICDQSEDNYAEWVDGIKVLAL